MKFRKKPVTVEATQWFKNGDHPQDDIRLLDATHGGQSKTIETEGKVVRYFRHPDKAYEGDHACLYCGRVMRDHGWIDTMEGGHIVCPGDWIITGVKGEFYPVKSDIFHETYELVEESNGLGGEEKTST